jgi:hypothetical protein
MGRCNPRWVFPINTCGRHRSSNTRTTRVTNASRSHRFCCCSTEATLSRLSTCIYDQESRPLEPSSSVILHWERANKVFGKRPSRLLARFVKFFTTARLPLHRSRTNGVTPGFKAKTRCSSYVCPGSSCHTYGQNVNTKNQCLYYISIITRDIVFTQKTKSTLSLSSSGTHQSHRQSTGGNTRL